MHQDANTRLPASFGRTAPFGRWWLGLLAALLFGTSMQGGDRGIKVTIQDNAGAAVPLYAESYALVIGNTSYEKGWGNLPGAYRDAQDVANGMRRNGFNVTLCCDLSKAEFENALCTFSLKQGSDPDNRLLVYFAGHGYTQRLSTGEDLGYLIMTNTPLPVTDRLGFDLQSVDMTFIITQSKKMRARHALFIFDSCFSGSFFSLRDALTPRAVSHAVSLPVRQFIAAGQVNESVPDHSFLKIALLDLIEGRAPEPIPDGYITGSELGLYLRTIIPEYNPSQHPQYGTLRDPQFDKGDFVFVRTVRSGSPDNRATLPKLSAADTPVPASPVMTPAPTQVAPPTVVAPSEYRLRRPRLH